MMGFAYQLVDKTKDVKVAHDRAAFKNTGHAAAAIRKDAIKSIEPGNGTPSAPGKPPHTQSGKLPRSIVYDDNKTTLTAVTGPRYSVVGVAGEAHEHGEQLGDTSFDERPFMGPALEKNLDRFGNSFAGSIGA